MSVLVDLQEDKLRRLIILKQRFLAFREAVQEDDTFLGVYKEIIEPYMEDLTETLEFHIEDIHEEIAESRETDVEDDFVINIEEND